MEKFLLEGNFTQEIVQCFNAPKVSAFDYNLLEPLQKLLRLSSPVAASLARPGLFSGILQKLNHKKAVVRLNLLRIVRSLCEPGREQANSIKNHKLFEAIKRLAENDNAVLVRNMASELVSTSLEKDLDSGNTGRIRASRRSSSYSLPGLHHTVSAPLTPTHASRAFTSETFTDGNVTPRRLAPSNGSDILYRPKSRDSSQIQPQRKTSSEIAGSTSKSRLPRTSLLRTSRSSIAAPKSRNETSSVHKDNSEGRLREKTRSAISPPNGGVATQPNPKRKTRAPSGDINWS